jgi:hypothetical protein
MQTVWLYPVMKVPVPICECIIVYVHTFKKKIITCLITSIACIYVLVSRMLNVFEYK